MHVYFQRNLWPCRFIVSFTAIRAVWCVSVLYVCPSTHSAITFNWTERNRILNKENINASGKHLRSALLSIYSRPFCLAHTILALVLLIFRTKKNHSHLFFLRFSRRFKVPGMHEAMKTLALLLKTRCFSYTISKSVPFRGDAKCFSNIITSRVFVSSHLMLQGRHSPTKFDGVCGLIEHWGVTFSLTQIP